ncbi:glycosyltransferase family 1 protein [Komagataeibacter melaceti]|uniref:Glycosyltransferase family 1 protein n=2 Tax=Komagataeibacter melaceti TaxID=2766577 RepID=A0A371YYQ4_9PROT|nr:glycosyltransferase family 1 protein [Komagataeibacter melaceti]
MDVSRLLSRAGNPVPTGIDRVEMEYVRYLLDHAAQRTVFVAMHPFGHIGMLEHAEVIEFIEQTEALWDGRETSPRTATWNARRLVFARTLLSRRNVATGGIYLLLSHHHLNRPEAIARFIRRHKAVFVPMVHDLIPLEFPEYARPAEPARHQRRIATVTSLAQGVIVPSQVVADSLAPFVTRSGRDITVTVIPHGLHLHALQPAPVAATPAARQERPYFVSLGTIEPRKNHLLLLNIWRDLVHEMGDAAPQLILVGRRGWENENIIDMLERCPALRGHVVEHNDLSDLQVVTLLQHSQGLLFPSFAEGFGLPLAEALALGVPCICSDLPVFREVAGNVATYLDPLDGPGWREAILAHMPQARPHRPTPAEVATLGFADWPAQAAKGIDFADAIATGRA